MLMALKPSSTGILSEELTYTPDLTFAFIAMLACFRIDRASFGLRRRISVATGRGAVAGTARSSNPVRGGASTKEYLPIKG